VSLDPCWTTIQPKGWLPTVPPPARWRIIQSPNLRRPYGLRVRPKTYHQSYFCSLTPSSAQKAETNRRHRGDSWQRRYQVEIGVESLSSVTISDCSLTALYCFSTHHTTNKTSFLSYLEGCLLPDKEKERQTCFTAVLTQLTKGAGGEQPLMALSRRRNTLLQNNAC